MPVNNQSDDNLIEKLSFLGIAWPIHQAKRECHHGLYRNHLVGLDQDRYITLSSNNVLP